MHQTHKLSFSHMANKKYATKNMQCLPQKLIEVNLNEKTKRICI